MIENLITGIQWLVIIYAVGFVLGILMDFAEIIIHEISLSVQEVRMAFVSAVEVVRKALLPQKYPE
jgi:hypothetical protein